MLCSLSEFPTNWTFSAMELNRVAVETVERAFHTTFPRSRIMESGIGYPWLLQCWGAGKGVHVLFFQHHCRQRSTVLSSSFLTSTIPSLPVIRYRAITEIRMSALFRGNLF